MNSSKKPCLHWLSLPRRTLKCRATIDAKILIPVGKETDRHFEQGEHNLQFMRPHGRHLSNRKRRRVRPATAPAKLAPRLARLPHACSIDCLRACTQRRCRMQPTLNQDKVIPESFRILLRKYLSKPETKSLAPDGTPCTGTTRGVLQRARITAGKLIPVGKETDRRWEQGEDPSMVDTSLHVYEAKGKMCLAHPTDRKRWSKIADDKTNYRIGS